MSFKNNASRAAVLVGLLAMTGCADMDTQQQRMLSGAAAGTAVGAIGTVMMGGCVACGAAIGGVVGTGAGYVIDQIDKNTKSSDTPSGSKYAH